MAQRTIPWIFGTNLDPEELRCTGRILCLLSFSGRWMKFHSVGGESEREEDVKGRLDQKSFFSCSSRALIKAVAAKVASDVSFTVHHLYMVTGTFSRRPENNAQWAAHIVDSQLPWRGLLLRQCARRSELLFMVFPPNDVFLGSFFFFFFSILGNRV